MSKVGDFFKNLLNRIRLRRLNRRLRRNANRMAAQINVIEGWVGISQERLQAAFDRHKRDSDEIQATVSALKLSVDDLSNKQLLYEKELEKLRTQLQISDKVTIPGIVQSNELLLQHLKAYTDLKIREQVAIKDSAG